MDVTRPLRRHAPGVTLLELVTTLAVSTVLLAAGIPAWSSFVTNHETVAAANAITSMLAAARTAAVTGKEPVVACPSSDGESCTGSYHWSQGWISFTDLDDDEDRGADEPLLQVRRDAVKQVHIQTSPGRREVVYKPDGSAGGTNLTFRICHAKDPDRRRAVIVSPSGRSRVSRRDAQGNNITCP